MHPPVFADTGFWIARLSPQDQLHRAAREAGSLVGKAPIVTTELVLAEVLNTLSGRGAFIRSRAVRLIETLRGDQQVEIIPSSTWFDEALSLYRERSDKSWSLTDCMSFAIMRRRGIEVALAHDHHFVQAGFTALLRDS